MIRRVNETVDSPIRLLFASFDEGLRDLARLLFTVSTEEFSEMLLVEALARWWPRAHAEKIVKCLAELLTQLDDESRKVRQENSLVPIDEMIRQGEQLLLSASGTS